MIHARHFRMAARYAAHRFRTLHPYDVQAVLLNACNLRCAYCRCPDIKTSLLTTEQWCATIRELAALGMLRIKFQGGEPTLRKDFRELCATSQRSSVRTAVITNGHGIAADPSLLDVLDEVVVSVDAATPDLHDRWRGAGSHRDTMTAVEAARARGIPTYVNMVVNRESFDELPAMLAWCEARGARLNAQPVMFDIQFYDDAARQLALHPEQIRALNRQLAEWSRTGRGVIFTAATYQRVAQWLDYATPTMPSTGESTCMAGRFYINIQANGDVEPCVQHGGPFTPKNILRDGLDAALHNAQHHQCGDCASAYLNERKALFALEPAALFEMMRRG